MSNSCTNAFRRFDVIIIALVAISSVTIKILQVVQCTQALICTWLAVSYSMNRTAVHMVRHPKPHKGFVRWL